MPINDRPLTFSIYKNVFDSESKPVTKTWEGWCEELKALHVVAKKDTFCFILGHVPKGEGHRNSTVRSICAMGIDLDEVTDRALEQVYAALEPYEFVMYSTFGHSLQKSKLRIVLPLAEEITPVEFSPYWESLNRLIGGHNDAQTKNIGRLWYVHSCPEERKDDAIFHRHPGKFLDQKSLVAAPVAAPPRPSSLPLPLPTAPTPDPAPAPTTPAPTTTSIVPLTKDFLVSEGRRRSRRSATRDRLIGSLLQAVGKGDNFAVKGGRERARYLLCDTIAEIWPNVDIDQAAELFRDSLTEMHKDEPLKKGVDGTIREVAYKLSRAKAKQATVKEERAEKKRSEEARLNLEARGDGQDTPYTEADLEHIAKLQHCAVDDLSHRWVVYKNGSAYFLNMAGYQGPYLGHDVRAIAAVFLSPVPNASAYHPPSRSDRTRMLKSYADLCAEYGSIIHDVEASLVQNYSSYTKRTYKLTEATAPKDPSIQPKRNPIVEKWLTLMSKEDTSKLIDWVAAVPLLENQCCALYLWGPKGTGKTLLLNGLARIWGLSDTTPLDAVLDQFNARLARMPLIVADEYLPDSKNISGKLRELIASTSHTLKRKYLPEASLIGSVRLVILGNTPHLLDLKGDHTKEDLDAIAERFLFIHTHKDAADYLADLPRETKDHLLNRGIAEHCLWLSRHWNIDEGKRFLVEGFLGEASLNISINNERTALICEWLVEYLSTPETLASNQKLKGLVKIKDGALWVNSYAIQKAWGIYMDKGSPLTARAIGIALKAIACKSEDNYKRERVNGQLRAFYRIDTELLASWSEAHGRMSHEDISEIVGCAPF